MKVYIVWDYTIEEILRIFDSREKAEIFLYQTIDNVVDDEGKAIDEIKDNFGISEQIVY